MSDNSNCDYPSERGIVFEEKKARGFSRAAVSHSTRVSAVTDFRVEKNCPLDW
jgi:hypothetical protein